MAQELAGGSGGARARVRRTGQHHVAGPQDLAHLGITFPRGRTEPAIVPHPRKPAGSPWGAHAPRVSSSAPRGRFATFPRSG
jgi:hypothetical protein